MPNLGQFKRDWTPAGPAFGSILLTTSDVADLAKPVMGIYCDVAGTVKFTDVMGNTDTWTVPAGGQIPVAIARVWATGTTATGLHGLLPPGD